MTEMTEMTETAVPSADGTPIAVETVGSGPPLVLTSGAFCDRTSTRVLAAALADRFTVHAWDRRGRGDSGGGADLDVDPTGDVAAAMVASEVADLTAVSAHAGGTPAQYGHSSGAILALEAVLRGMPASRVAVYEPPWRDDAAEHRRVLAGTLLAALRDGRPGDAAEEFLTGGPGVPRDVVAGMRRSPMWARMELLAPSLPHDLALAGREGLPVERLGALTVDLLALDGGASTPWARASVAALVAAVPGARHHSVPDQDHGVDQTVLAPVLASFLSG